MRRTIEAVSFPFVKGHGTHNDFVVLPDLDASVHGDLAPDVVAALCHRRGGVGADGVLRVIRGSFDGGAGWFMDYRNADGSPSQMCGNGIRVFARYLQTAGLVDPTRLDGGALPVDTRGGVKWITWCDDGEISVDMGMPELGGRVDVSVDGHHLTAARIDTGNPHAVVFVDSLADAGVLRHSPVYCADEFPEGVNVEFVMSTGDRSVAMRVFERGVGETRSCGTGACAAVAATAAGYAETLRRPDAGSDSTPRGQVTGGPAVPTTFDVAVSGGRLSVTWDADGHLHLKGPAVLVAEGSWLD